MKKLILDLNHCEYEIDFLKFLGSMMDMRQYWVNSQHKTWTLSVYVVRL